MGSLSKQQLYRLSGVLFLLAAAAFLFSPARWMSAVEGVAGIGLLVASFRIAPPPPPDRRPPRRSGRP